MNKNQRKNRKVPYYKKHSFVLAASIALITGSIQSFAADSWPGESTNNALALGSLEDDFSDGDISGAHWNNNTNTLWLSDNKEEKIWSLIESGSSFVVGESFEGSGDLEGITQAMDDNVLYLMDEDRYIRSYSASNGNSITTWDIANALPSNGDDDKDGPEGITFIPDAWLSSSNFRDNNGDLYSQSQFDLGGIFLVAHQNGGGVYALDLSSDGGYAFVGQYDTAREESSGLEFDRSTGILYISHNIDDNTLETTNLSSISSGSHREFTTLYEFEAPNDSNLEGFALKQAINNDGTANDVWAFYVDDDGDDNAILVFKNLTPTLNVTTGNNQTADANTAVSTSPVVQLNDRFNNALADTNVDFTVSQGGGSLVGDSTFTNNSGLATLNTWTLGSTGEQQVTASAGSTSATIHATITGNESETGEGSDEGGDEETSIKLTATASSDDGNVASNAVDVGANANSTRWSASGEQWLQLDLGSSQNVNGVSLAFYKGDERSSIFDLSTSTNGTDWDIQRANVYSSGNSEQAEDFYFNSTVEARYVRYDGHGNTDSEWNSILDASVLTIDGTNDNDDTDNSNNDDDDNSTENTAAPITSLQIHSVSNEQSSNPAVSLFDGDTSDNTGARWSAEGLSSENQWVIFDMGDDYQISHVALFPFSDRAYQYTVQISTSANGNFTTIIDRSNNTLDDNSIEDTTTNTASGRYLKLEVQGANNYSGNWASINELTIEGILK